MAGAAGDTVISTNDPLAVTLYSVSLHSEVEKRCVFIRQMSGPISNEMMATAKRERNQTTPDMPIVIINDLTDNAGDNVTADMFHIVTGKPFMGDSEMEGRGQPLTFSTMNVKINQTRFPIKPGGRMTRKRTVHNLRRIARANMASYFARLNDQIIQTHLSGARGAEFSEDWALPLESDPDFASIMINPLEPPTSNRYFVAGGGTVVSDVGDTDALKLEDIDVLATTLRDMPFPPSPIKVMTAKGDEEITVWCLLVTERVWHYIETRSTNKLNSDWRKALADCAQRAMTTGHPLFRGGTAPALWNSIIIKKMPRAIRFPVGTGVRVVSSADNTTVTTTNTAVTCDRSILLGGQALALARGDSQGPRSGAFPMRWTEVLRDHGNSIEIGGGQMDGKRKMRFRGSDGQWTDYGVAVIDSYAPDPRSIAGQTLRNALS